MIYRNLPTFVLVFLQRSKENTEGFTIEEGTRDGIGFILITLVVKFTFL